jgi:hypothetical protein
MAYIVTSDWCLARCALNFSGLLCVLYSMVAPAHAHRCRKLCEWRTLLVVPELEKEVAIFFQIFFSIWILKRTVLRLQKNKILYPLHLSIWLASTFLRNTK